MYSAITSNSEVRIRCFPNIYGIPKALLNPTPDFEKPLLVISTAVLKLNLKLISSQLIVNLIILSGIFHCAFYWILITFAIP